MPRGRGIILPHQTPPRELYVVPRASPTVLRFSFCKTRSLPSLKSICQVTKLSVSNGFGKIELVKPNGGPGHYFFTRFFSSRCPLRRTGSLARSPARCFALPPPLVCVGAFTLRKKVGDDGACGGVSLRGGRRRAVRLCVAKRSRRWIGTLCRDMSRWKFPLYGAKRSRRHVGDQKPRRRRDRSAFAKSSGIWQKCQVSSLICQLCQNTKLKCKTNRYLHLSFLVN